MSFESDIDTRKTLLEVAPEAFADADVDDDIALLARRLAAKPLRKYTVTDLYGVIRRHLALSFTAPLAIERLEGDPFLKAAEYPGDLLVALLESDTRFWQDHHDLWQVMIGILGEAVHYFNEALATQQAGESDSDREREVWLPDYLGDDFMAALIHFRGIHTE